jgi:hypothetical protein
MRLVYSMYPIVARDRYTKLDLVELAKEYHEVMPLLESSN